MLRIPLLHIYEDLMYEWLGTMCTARTCSMCEHVSVFLCEFWPLVLHFCLLFHFFYIFPYSVFCSRVCLSSLLPFSVLRFLVSPSRFFFSSDSSIVDYFAVRADCPLIALLFAHLGSLLESIEREHLERVSSFIGEDCLYTFVLSSLFPLVSHSAKVARSLRMSEVRSSDLEMRLSSSDDRVVSRATFVSTPYKAWNISCSLIVKDVQ